MTRACDHSEDNQGLCHRCGVVLNQDRWESYMGKAKTKVPARFKAPSREAFESLLFAAYNIGPGVEPDDAAGRNLTNSAMRTAKALYDLMENKTEASVQGVLLAVRLLAETTCADDPEGYALHEAVRGNTNYLRVEDRGATIKLPEGVKLKKARKGS